MAKAKSYRKFDLEELKLAAEHIAFEIHHFRCYSVLRRDKKLEAACPAATQAIGYAELLHLRVLIDFFFCEPEHDDCHVVHFGALPGFTAAFPPTIHQRTARTDQVVKYLNKLLAHFTATRWEKQRPAWNFYEEFEPVIESVATRFEDALPANVRKSYDKGLNKWSGHTPTFR